jgi:hypothetical protein
MDFGVEGHLYHNKTNERRGLRGPRRRGRLCARLVAFAASFAFAACAWAQQGAQEGALPPAPDPGPPAPMSGSIHGVVTSDNGSVYEGARVELELSHDEDPATATQKTDSGGAFNFANLPAGEFKLTISSIGFVTQSISGVLHAGEAFDARTIVLPVASTTSVVEVSAESRVEIAQEQLNLEEKQRVLGAIPNYYVSYDPNAVPLTSRQKYQLAWRTSVDPMTWLMVGTFAGMEQADNTFAGYGQGMQGYGKRFGANYADGLFDTMIGGAVLPSLFKQDPRYFYKGTGTIRSRAMYAIANSVICKGDNGRWQPNYSAILGGLAAGGISNLYYPASNRSGVELTFENALTGAAEGAVQNLFQEFVVRRLTPRLSRYGAGAP